MGLFDMATKLLGTIPVVGPLIDAGSTFFNMDKPGDAGVAGRLFPKGYQPIERPDAPRIPIALGGRSAMRPVGRPSPNIENWKAYMQRFRSTRDIMEMARRDSGKIVLATIPKSVSPVRTGKKKKVG